MTIPADETFAGSRANSRDTDPLRVRSGGAA